MAAGVFTWFIVFVALCFTGFNHDSDESVL